MAVKPIVLAMVLCDSTIKEANTGKQTLVGTFNCLYSNIFPCLHHTLSIYVAITEVHNRVPCKLRILTSNNQIMFDLPGQVEIGGPTNVAELVFQLNQVRFDQPGVYLIEFWANDELIALRKINVLQIIQQGGTGV